MHEAKRTLLPKVLAILKARTDRDFSRYKSATLLRRIGRRMQLNYVDDLAQYLELLREQPDEARTLADDLLINVTSFFRDAEVFEKLEKEIVPKLFENKSTGDTVRVWSVGCATGEEAYSLAMLLLEEQSLRPESPKIQIFASDLHKRSLENAREGLYPGDIETDVSGARLQRFFQKENGAYRICKEVRDVVVFASHNLLGDPPFSRLDLISCRNLLIYLERSVQRDVIDLFHYALCPGGFLLLGSAETAEASELFRTDDKKLCIYEKRNVPAPEPRLPVFPLTRVRQDGERSNRPEYLPVAVPFQSVHQDLLERFAPPSILVGVDNRILHLSDNAGRYLVLPGGEMTSSVLRLVREELRISLQSLLQMARETKQPVDSAQIVVRFVEFSAPVVMHVRPAQDADQEGFALVIFEEHQSILPSPSSTSSRVSGTYADGDAESRIAVLEAALLDSKQQLQTVIEEYETSQEEMKAANEEMQSTNEELRSTMEELETSKEELQSINEELQTVNQENRHKVEELSQLSSDLQNLLASTDIATLFLDRDMRILRFTPRLSDIFNVRVTDRGRPISDLTHRLGYQNLREDALEVLDRLAPLEREIEDNRQRWYLTRILPYRSVEDRIEGIVITFTDITHRKQAEDAVRESEENFRGIANVVPDLLWYSGADGSTPWFNDRWLAYTGQGVKQASAWGWTDAIHPDDRETSVRQYREAVEQRRPMQQEHRIRQHTGEYRWFLIRAEPSFDATGRVKRMYGAAIDIHDRRVAMEALQKSEETLASDLTNAELLRGLAERLVTEESFETIYEEVLSATIAVAQADAATVQIYNSEAKSLQIIQSKNFSPLVTDHFAHVDASSLTACGIALKTGQRAFVDFTEVAADTGCTLLVKSGIRSAIAVPLVSRTGAPLGMLNAHWRKPKHRPAERDLRFLDLIARQVADLIEQRRAQRGLRESEARLAAAFESVPVGLAVINHSGEVTLANAEFRRFLPSGVIPSRDSKILERWRGWDSNGRALEADEFPGARALRGETVVPGTEILYTDETGQTIWTSIATSPTRDQAGHVTGIVCVISDINAAKCSAEALRTSEEQFRLFVDNVLEYALVQTDFEGVITSWNPGAERLFGFSSEAVIGQPFSMLLPEGDRHDGMIAREMATLSQGEKVIDAHAMQRKDGTHFWAEWITEPVLDDAGKLRGTAKVIRDESERQEVKQTLEENERRLRAVLEGIPQLVWRSHDEGQWTWASAQWQIFTGQTQEESLGEGWLNVIHPEDHAATVAAWVEADKTGKLDVEHRILRARDGVYVWHHTRSLPAPRPEGITREWLGTSTDIEASKAAAAEKDALLREVHHRVKNNLQVIVSLLNMQSSKIQDEGVLSHFQEARNRVLAISSIHELLYRADSFAGIVLVDYTRQLAPDLLHFYGLQSQITLTITGEGSKLELERAVPFGMLLNELISNACKHAFPAERKGTLHINVDRQGDTLELKVSDDGVGIPESFRYEEASSLGLRLVHALAGQLGGSVQVSSTQGTTVTVRFPAEATE